MFKRFRSFCSVGALLASAVVATGISPADADSFEDWDTVSTGPDDACGVRHGGKLYCWGISEYGELGPNSGSTPHRIGIFEDWAGASPGYAHTCGVRKNGKLYCWGINDYGQLGYGNALTHTDIPHRIGTFEDWNMVDVGHDHSCGIRHRGKLYCWGLDNKGQVGDGSMDGDGAGVPRRIGTFEDWATVSAGNYHTCGVRTNGKLYCWGDDSNGQVGDGIDTNALSPRRVGTNFADWSSVSAGQNHSCAIRGGGKLYCWGADHHGQLGDGTDLQPLATAPRHIGTLEDWSKVSAGFLSTCGVRKNGKLYCWGDDSAAGGDAPAPTRIGTAEDWSKVSAGGVSCGIRHDGWLYCWGLDIEAEMNGDYDAPPISTPERV